MLEENDSFSAAAVARDFRPDVAILDVDMPGKDGGEVAIEFRNDPLLKDVTLIFMSGLISAKEKGVRNGGVYLPKPFPLAALKQVIDIILTGRNAAEEQWSGSRAHLSSEVNFEAVASN